MTDVVGAAFLLACLSLLGSLLWPELREWHREARARVHRGQSWSVPEQREGR